MNKYLYGYKIFVNYGQGWEYECFETSHKGLRENVRAYRENCAYPVRWSAGREVNPTWENEQLKQMPELGLLL